MWVRIGNGESIPALGRGNINIHVYANGIWNEKHLSNVLYVPNIELNLFSEEVAIDKGLKLMFEGDNCQIIKGHSIIVVGTKENKLFEIGFKVMGTTPHSQRNETFQAHAETQGGIPASCATRDLPTRTLGK